MGIIPELLITTLRDGLPAHKQIAWTVIRSNQQAVMDGANYHQLISILTCIDTQQIAYIWPCCTRKLMMMGIPELLDRFVQF